MKIKEINAKSIITKSGLPGADFVINPHLGCEHGCKYCYARFMKRFSGHTEPWCKFVDVKINAPKLSLEISPGMIKNKSVIIGSVCDPYQPLERKYKLTRQILKNLIPLQPRLDIMTKSDLVLRDVDLLKQLNNVRVAISLSMLDDKKRGLLENKTPKAKNRFTALKKLKQEGIKTTLFISPIFPEITEWKEMIKKTKNYVDEYWFENLNFYPSIHDNIYTFLQKINPKLREKYKNIYFKQLNYWAEIEEEIRNFCQKEKANYKIYFHHKKSKQQDQQ